MESPHSNAEALRVELLFENESFSIARIALRGINKAAINHSSTTSYTVLEGTGTMYVGEKSQKLAPGDVVSIPAGTVYYDEGNLDMLAISIPPFDSASVEIIE